jgi:Uma2 family endonuclease
MRTRTRMTLAEFLAIPGIDGSGLELVDGEVIGWPESVAAYSAAAAFGPHRLRAEEFLALPSVEERRWELFDGEVVCRVAPSFDHGALQLEVGHLLRPFGHAATAARTVIRGSGDRRDSALLPDVAFFRRGAPRPHGVVIEPPHLVVEILSAGQSHVEARAEADVYLAFGVESVWLIDPDVRSVDVFEGGTRRTLVGGDLLTTASVPGLEIAVSGLFAVLDEPD